MYHRLIHGFMGPAPQNSISTGSTVSAGLTRVTNTHTHTQTDRPTDTQTMLRQEMRRTSPHLALVAVLAMRANVYHIKRIDALCVEYFEMPATRKFVAFWHAQVQRK